MTIRLLLSRISALAAGSFLAMAISVGAGQAQALKIGVSAGPYGEVLEEAARLAVDEGLQVEIVEFTEWTMINEALHNGDIDANNFQHAPYLENQVAARGYDIVALERSIVVPMALYSAKVSALDELPDGSAIGVPNDPTNSARALILLALGGVIELDQAEGVGATPADITSNPKNLNFVELDAAQLPRSLDDLDAAVITLNYAVLAGLDPQASLLAEDKASEWTLVWAVRRDRQEDETIRRFIDIYRSHDVRHFVLTRFEGTILPTW